MTSRTYRMYVVYDSRQAALIEERQRAAEVAARPAPTPNPVDTLAPPPGWHSGTLESGLVSLLSVSRHLKILCSQKIDYRVFSGKPVQMTDLHNFCATHLHINEQYEITKEDPSAQV